LLKFIIFLFSLCPSSVAQILSQHHSIISNFEDLLKKKPHTYSHYNGVADQTLFLYQT